MSRSWCWSLLGLALGAGCLLPEAEVDSRLDSETKTEAGSAQGGGGGAAGAGGTSTSGGSGGTSLAMVPDKEAGGAAGSNMMTGMGVGGSGEGTPPVMPPPIAGAGGGTNMAAAGAGSSGMRVAMADCAGASVEEACAAYCLNYTQSCGDFPAAYTYENITDCGSVCNNSPWPVGNIAEKGSILCRCYHATLALNNGLTPHCFHAAEVPSMAGGCAP